MFRIFPYFLIRHPGAVVRGWFYGFNPLKLWEKIRSALKVSLFTVIPLPRKPMMMYSVSYFCTKMHQFKTKIPKKIPHPRSFVRPHSHIVPHSPNEIPGYCPALFT